jgi:hypothetical protein
LCRTRSLALRVDRTSENRAALALITLISVAIFSVLATTSAVSRHYTAERVTLISP